jgi:F-type H+-transporting ATPase subunit delta
VNYTPIDRNIAKKYAKAFMAVFPRACTLADMGKISIAQKFLQTHKQTLLFLQLPQFDQDRKKSMIADLISHFSLPEQLSTIMFLLITHNRSFYIPDVLLCITQLYKEQTNSIEFSLKSTQILNEKQVESIKQFLGRLLNKNIIATSSLDASLIAGLRLQSNDYLWEYSVRKHMQTLLALEK